MSSGEHQRRLHVSRHGMRPACVQSQCSARGLARPAATCAAHCSSAAGQRGSSRVVAGELGQDRQAACSLLPCAVRAAMINDVQAAVQPRRCESELLACWALWLGSVRLSLPSPATGRRAGDSRLQLTTGRRIGALHLRAVQDRPSFQCGHCNLRKRAAGGTCSHPAARWPHMLAPLPWGRPALKACSSPREVR